ncbi:serine/threonine protein kinase [Pseudosporangium ferrugineum]|uniref:Serine/threonine protein kinase n=1 Tax=Pseudosporangium ferrugineum TaxID=439699 RepID=A0A2T0RQQ8_9ACTN|nr:serine/threonine protein kinase [Pseudosporangium ferrugineum]
MGIVLRVTQPLMPGDPRRLGGYELLRRLGQGGMGTVFLGRSPDGRLVAVKMVRPEYAWDTEFRGRFRSEVNRAREVPGFCTAAVLDADPDHETPYLVVEYVDGPSLSQVIRERGALDGGTLHSVAVGVATALAAIHGAGVIHRDLKPQSVLFSLGTPKVIDFGIARALEVTSRHTRPDQMVGTVAYMAPERFEADSDRRAGAPADVFAWGVVVAYAATGRTPFGTDSPAATAARILTQPPDLTGIEGPLRSLVERALAKDPADRPTAHQLLDLLLEAETGGGLAQRPELLRAAEAAQHTGRVPRPAPRAGRRRLTRLVAASAAAAVVSAGIGLAVSRGRSDQTSASFVSGPAASPSPAPAAPATPLLQGPSVSDRLDRPGLWKADERTTHARGWCTFDRRMLATTHEASLYRCRGPEESFTGDHTIAVDTGIVTRGSCAVIWFRYVGTSGYVASFCEKEVRLGIDTNSGNGFTGERTAATTAFRPGRTHRVGIAVRDGTAGLTVDGAALLSLPLTEPLLVAGRIELGVLNESAGDSASVSFADVELRSPVAGERTPFADPATGSGTSVVRLYSYDPDERAAVAQPVRVLDSADYCEQFRVDPDDLLCSDPYQVVESRQKVTIPVRRSPALRVWEGPIGDVPAAVRTGEGSGKISVSNFRIWLAENPGALVAVTTSNGTATRLTAIRPA